MITSLSLSRKQNQSIHIDEDIVIWIDKTSPSKVQVTIEAPS